MASSPPNLPGRLAPRWVEDLTASFIPEVDSVISSSVKARLSECGRYGPHRHDLAIVANQTTLEGITPAVLSLVCRGCDHHFVVEIQWQPESTLQPCNHGLANYSPSISGLPAEYTSQLMHHLIKTGSWDDEQCQQKRSPRYPLIGRVEFACSQPRCALQVSLEISEPRLALKWLQLLNDPGRMKRNLEEARSKDPDRYASTPEETVGAAFKVLSTYLRNLLADPELRKISRRNKRFQIVFGTELLPLFHAVGYTEETADNNGVPEDFLVPQPLEPAQQDSPIPLDYLRAYIDNLQVEVSNHVPGTALSEAFNAVPRLLRELHCQGYPTSLLSSRILSDDKDFLTLGVLPSMHETLIHFGFRAQVATWPEKKVEYVEAFAQASTQLGNNDLLEQAGKDMSLLSAEEDNAGRPEASQDHGAIWSAAAYFGLSNPSEGPDYRLVASFKEKQAEDPSSAESHLRALVKHRDSRRLHELLAGRMSVDTAMEILGLPKGQVAADEFVKSYADVAMTNPPDNRQPVDAAWISEVVEALDIIALQRGSNELVAKSIEIGGSATLAEPTKPRLDIPVGLDNIGNTCYLNSCLQLLYSVRPVRDFMLHGSDRMIDLAADDTSTRRIGSGKDTVSVVEACLGQLFTREIMQLYVQLNSTQAPFIKPSQRLAEAALVSAGAVTQELEKKHTQAPKTQQNTDTDQSAVPPVPPRRPSDSDIRVEHVDFPEDVDMINVSVDAVSETASDVSSKTLVEDTVEVVKSVNAKPLAKPDTAAAELPPPTSEDVEMTDTADVTLNALDPPARMKAVLDACSRMRTRESGTDQQDVEETMGSMLNLIQFAIKPHEVRDDGVQNDLITDLFYLKRRYYSRKENEQDFRCTETSIDRSIVAYPAEKGSCTIYEALGRGLDIETLDGGQQRFSTLAELPPVLFIHIQRTKTSGAKNSNPVVVEEMLYLDRFMDTDPNSELMELRKCGWQLQDRLDKFAAHAPQEKPVKGPVNKPSAAALAEEAMADGEVTQSLLADMPAANLQLSSDTFSFDLPTPPPEPLVPEEAEVETLSVDGLPTMAKVQEMSEQLLQENRDAMGRLYAENKKEAYRLHAVICHSGGLNAGHYWVWIYDGRATTWRKYNDSIVTAEPNSKRVFDTLNQGDAPYFLCYVRDDVRDEYVSIPERNAEATEPTIDADNGVEVTEIRLAPFEGAVARQNTPLDRARERYDSDIENERMVLGALNEFMVGEKRALPGDAMNEQSCKKQRTDSAVWDSVLESDDDDFTLPFIDVDDEEMGDEDTDEDC